MARMLRRTFATAAVAVLLPGVAMAQGMPQLNFSNPLTLGQVEWGAVIFVIFFLLCWRWALPQVGSVLEQRANTIAADLEAARHVKAEADTAAAEMTKAIAQARAEAQGAISAAVDKAKQEAAARTATLNEQLEQQLKESEQRIGAAQVEAMRALRTVAGDAANTLVERLTGTRPDPARVEQAVGAVMAARGQA